MSRFYEEPNRITFDDAEVIVDRYIRKYTDIRTRVTGKQLANAEGIKQSQHNLIRINQALDDRLKKTRQTGSTVAQYSLEEIEEKQTMKAEIAEACAKSLREDNRVEEAEVVLGDSGPYVELTPTDTYAKHDVRRILDEYPIWIEVMDPCE